MSIIHRQYRLLSDHPLVYQFMLEIYERDWRNGVPAPFLEYAQIGRASCRERV